MDQTSGDLIEKIPRTKVTPGTARQKPVGSWSYLGKATSCQVFGPFPFMARKLAVGARAGKKEVAQKSSL